MQNKKKIVKKTNKKPVKRSSSVSKGDDALIGLKKMPSKKDMEEKKKKQQKLLAKKKKEVRKQEKKILKQRLKEKEAKEKELKRKRERELRKEQRREEELESIRREKLRHKKAEELGEIELDSGFGVRNSKRKSIVREESVQHTEKKPVKKTTTNKKTVKKKKVELTEEEKKKLEKRSKFFKVVIPLIIAVVTIIAILFHLPAFAIKHIEVRGQKKISSEQILEYARVNEGDNLLAVSELVIRNRIKDIPYIDEVKVIKNLPSELIIEVEEKVVSFFINYGDKYALLDEQGFLIEFSEEYPADLSIITGLETKEQELQKSKRVNSKDLQKLNVVIKILRSLKNKEMISKLTALNIEDLSEIILEFKNDNKTVYLGKANNIDIQLETAKQIMEKNTNSSGKIFVDMDLSEKRAYYREDI